MGCVSSKSGDETIKVAIKQPGARSGDSDSSHSKPVPSPSAAHASKAGSTSERAGGATPAGTPAPELTLLGSLSEAELLRLFGFPDETPLPEGSTWYKNGGAELEPLFKSTTLVDARWLLKLARGEVLPESKGVVPAWQLLPAAAVVS